MLTAASRPRRDEAIPLSMLGDKGGSLETWRAPAGRRGQAGHLAPPPTKLERRKGMLTEDKPEKKKKIKDEEKKRQKKRVKKDES